MKSTKYTFLTIALSFVLSALIVTQTSARASGEPSLYDAKERGLVGETLNGMVDFVTEPQSDSLKNLVKNVNQKRLETYQSISIRQSTSLRAVQKLAAKNIIEKLPKGHYYQTPTGKWQQKR